MKSFYISGNIVDIINKEIFPGTVFVSSGRIAEIRRESHVLSNNYIMPGFVDSHIHIESSMLVPSEFARIAVRHGTVATVSDPHEIANVLGKKGIDFMVENGRQVPFKFNFGAPSCVPATSFETAGGKITPANIRTLLARDDIKYLSEMMNYPGVLSEDPEVMEKLAAARKALKPVDGHAPGVRGEAARKYISAGISTDHECFSIDEALEKISYGMKILIREGSAAKNFEELHPIITRHPDMCMFCSDDKHPDDLLEGHINEMAVRAISLKHDLWDVLKCAILNPILHYKLDVGLLREGDEADFIIVEDLTNFKVLKTYIKGELAAENGDCLIPSVSVESINNFNINKKKPEDFLIPSSKDKIKVIGALDGQLVTYNLTVDAKTENGHIIPDLDQDILKICVVNRYEEAKPAVSFIKGFGLKQGAIATSVAHDSHNIIAVGTNDNDICSAVNEVIKNRGGMAAVSGNDISSLPLPIAGLMSIEDGITVAQKYAVLERKTEEFGSILQSPFMTLSFMALLVIPSLKLSDKGLFDGEKFEFVDIYV